jgi:hypothetical protein
MDDSAQEAVSAMRKARRGKNDKRKWGWGTGTRCCVCMWVLHVCMTAAVRFFKSSWCLVVRTRQCLYAS